MASYSDYFPALAGYGEPAPRPPFASAPLYQPIPSPAPAAAVAMPNWFGDQAGDFPMPQMASNPGWAANFAGPAAGGAAGPGMFDQFQGWMRSSGLLGSTDANGIKTEGWGGLALGGVSALGNMFSGLRQYELAKDQLNFSKSAFNKNFEAQRKSTNSALEDRQAARVASNPGAYDSVGNYMKKFGV